jgi:hypothetical protein
MLTEGALEYQGAVWINLWCAGQQKNAAAGDSW